MLVPIESLVTNETHAADKVLNCYLGKRKLANVKRVGRQAILSDRSAMSQLH